MRFTEASIVPSAHGRNLSLLGLLTTATQGDTIPMAKMDLSPRCPYSEKARLFSYWFTFSLGVSSIQPQLSWSHTPHVRPCHATATPPPHHRTRHRPPPDCSPFVTLFACESLNELMFDLITLLSLVIEWMEAQYLLSVIIQLLKVELLYPNSLEVIG